MHTVIYELLFLFVILNDLSRNTLVRDSGTLSMGRIVQGKNVVGTSVGDTSPYSILCVSGIVFCSFLLLLGACYRRRRPALVVRQRERG
jgi:hypothetical protein